MQQRPQHSKARGGGRFIAIAVAALAVVAAGVAWALSTQVAYDEYAPVTVKQELPAAVTQDTWVTVQFKDTGSGEVYRQAVKVAAGSTSASAKVMLGVYRSYEVSIASEQSSWRYENEKATYGNSTDDGGNDTWTATATTVDDAAATKLPATLKIGTVDNPVLDRTVTLTAKKANDQWESDVASVVNTVTMPAQKTVTFDNQGHGNAVATQVITADGTKSITEPTAAQVGTSDGLSFDGWYTDAKCTEANKFDSDDFAAKVSDSTALTLYANWIPAADGDALTYWISPSWKTTTSNTSVNVQNSNYVKEEWNVKKSSAEIAEDLKVLEDTAHATYNVAKYNEVKTEYEGFMNNDDYHLYTKLATAQTADEDNYVEFRIINVGEHFAVGDSSDGTTLQGDSTQLTFQATHALPSAYQMHLGATNEGGWGASLVREKMQQGGEIYNLFNSGFTDDIASVVKYWRQGSTGGYVDYTVKNSADKLWLLAQSEYINEGNYYAGTPSYNTTKEGEEYAYWADKIVKNNSANASAAYIGSGKTRSGADAANVNSSDRKSWQRGPGEGSTTRFKATISNGDINGNSYTDASYFKSVVPAFSLRAAGTSYTVSFDMQDHGNTVKAQQVAANSTAAEPTADEYGAPEGVVFGGWYTNSWCDDASKFDFSTPITEDTVLYANWKLVEDDNAYWIAPALECITGTAAPATNSEYVSEVTHTKKTCEEIRADLQVLKAGSGNAKYAETLQEYQSFMANDNYHLYTKIGTGTSKDDYVEFRIVNIGEHTSTGDKTDDTKYSDGSTLTFQATRGLPTAMAGGAATDVAWAGNAVRTALQSGGSFYNLFNTDFVGDIMPAQKWYYCTPSSVATLKSTTDVFWIASYSEYVATNSYWSTYPLLSEGDQFQFWNGKVLNDDTANNALRGIGTATTRGGTAITGFNGGNYVAMERTIVGTTYPSVKTNGDPDGRSNGSANLLSIVPCFTFGNAAYSVSFNMNGHGTQVKSQGVTSGQKATAPTAGEYGTVEGLTLEGWYNNPNCLTTGTTGTTANKKWNFDTDTVTANTTLYANWVPADDGDAVKYWISPASKITTGNTTATASVDNANYAAEAWNVKKSSKEIEADVLVLKKGATSDNPTYATVLAEYQGFMNNDDYHLYTAWKGSTTDASETSDENGYCEFRIIEVGAHDGGETLTFQATHMLPTAYAVNTSDARTGGFPAMNLHTLMNSGAIWTSFNEGFRDDLFSLTKTSNNADDAATNVTSDDCLWLLSAAEIGGEAMTTVLDPQNNKQAYPTAAEGSQYTWYANKGINTTYTTWAEADKNLNPCMNLPTRAGNLPSGAYSSWDIWWMRSPSYAHTDWWGAIYYEQFARMNKKLNAGIVPAFAFGGYLVQFDSQGGSEVDSQLLKSKTKAAKPTDPTRDGYAFKGWYKDSACTEGQEFDFDNDTVSADTTLYAKWDSVADSYWLNYAGVDKPEEGVLKTKSDIQADLAALRSGAGADYERVLAEYEGYMHADGELAGEVHLYTKLKDRANTTTDADGNSIAANDYVEWRIVELGAHAGDGTTITWQMAHVLPTAQAMNGTDTNAGGYAASALHTKVAEGGEIYSMFRDEFLSDILAVGKTSNTGSKGTATTTTSDKLWVASAEEVYGTTAATSGAVAGGEGTQYSYYAEKGVEKGDATNECLAYRTRAGGLPDGQSTDYDDYHGGSEEEMYASWWLRSPSAYNEQTYTRVYNDGRLDHNLATVKRGVALTCAMQGVDYTIDKDKMQTALKGLAAKPSTLKFVTGESLQGVAGLTSLAAAGIQEDGSGKIGVFQSADSSTVYIAPMDDGSATPVDNSYVLHAPEDCENFLRGTSAGTGLQKYLTTLDLSNLSTAKATTMKHMFSYLTYLTSLDASGLDTGNVTDMDFMFYYCASLTSLDVSGFDTRNVTSMGATFGHLTALESLDIDNFDTSKVTNMYYMFETDSVMKSLTIDEEKFDTGNVESMWGMFLRCAALTSLDVSSFNTAKVTDMRNMFEGCSALTDLDLSSFDTGSVTSMTNMFLNDNRLQSVTLGKDFAFAGTDGYLPTPSSSYITGADGNWYDTVTGTGYTPANLATAHSTLGAARTYVAVKPTNYYWLAAAGASNPSDETAMIKKQSDIDEDMAVLRGTKTATSAGEDKDAVTTRWKGYMNGNTRLYANWKGSDAGTGANRWVEFRIIQVGEHDGDGSAVTFMATHGLTEALAMTEASTNEGGWSGSTLRQTLNTAGGYLKTGLSELVSSGHVKAVNKEGVVNTSGTPTTTVTSDEFWIPSYSELYGKDVGYIASGELENEGSQYAWCQANVTDPESGNASLEGIFKRRDGTYPPSYATYYTWLRTPYYKTEDCFATLYPGDGSPDAGEYHTADRKYGVPLCFAM